MKTNHLIFKLLICAAAVTGLSASAMAIAGCAQTGEPVQTVTPPPHTHTFGEAWSSDADFHWHAATCQHSSEVSEKAPHVDEDHNDKCDVCGSKMVHVHRYSQEWAHDATNHWHEPVCGDTMLVADKEVHAWDDGEITVAAGCETDGEKVYTCTVCGEKQSITLPATGHHKSDILTERLAPTCSAEGMEAHYNCTGCNQVVFNAQGEQLSPEQISIQIDPNAHKYDEGKITKQAICGSRGQKEYSCIYNPEHPKKYEVIPATGKHTWNDEGICSTCQTPRVYSTATYTLTTPDCIDDILYALLPSVFSQKKYSDEYVEEYAKEFAKTTSYYFRAIGESRSYTIDVIYMGEYPQSCVTDQATLAYLNSTVPQTPNAQNHMGFTPFKNYVALNSENNTPQSYCSEFMYYKDITYQNNKYRALYFDSYRYSDNYYYPNPQLLNGYEKGQVYWFKFEPIMWMNVNKTPWDYNYIGENGKYETDPDTGLPVLRRKNDGVVDPTGETAVLWSVFALDGQPFLAQDDPRKQPVVHYDVSYIRNWLNSDFYNTAFSSDQKDIIINTEVDNSSESTVFNPLSPGGCDNTFDNLFLFSCKEIIYDYDLKAEAKSTGLCGRWSSPNVVTQKIATDYARAQGATVPQGRAAIIGRGGEKDDVVLHYNQEPEFGYCEWLSRSPYDQGTSVCAGAITNRSSVGATSDGWRATEPRKLYGICPALKINL